MDNEGEDKVEPKQIEIEKEKRKLKPKHFTEGQSARTKGKTWPQFIL